MATKEHRRRAVKKSATSPRTFEALARSIARMDVDYYFELPDHSDWLRALDQETGPSPATEEANRRIDLAKKTRAQMNRVLDFQRQFAELLPREAMLAWLELTRVMLSANIADSIMHFNVGVDLGRDMRAVEAAIERAGLIVEHLEETRLFALAHEIGAIARELAGVRKPGGKGGGRQKR